MHDYLILKKIAILLNEELGLQPPIDTNSKVGILQLKRKIKEALDLILIV